jgi:anaerobic magnesium-protoporphyrin IX monomethyl ester cyclase
MNILLIRYFDNGNINTRLPESVNKAQGIYPPLGLAYIAAAIEKAGHHVNILDAQALNITSTEARNLILKENADIIGITCMTSNFRGALEAAKYAKESGALVILGGPQISAYPKESLVSELVDYGIIGEGERSIVTLIEKIQKKDFMNFDQVKGLVYKHNNNTFVNEPDIIDNLDELPFPAMHLLPVEKYDCVITEKPVLTMITSRGCPYQCGFCFKQPSDKLYRKREPRTVVDEIEFYIRNYKLKEILFYDDTLTLDREHIVGICNEILKRKLKIKWQAPTRIDRTDKSLLLLMKKAGCRMLRYGVESGDKDILKAMKKGTDLNKVVEVFRLTKEVGIETFAYFIIGYAGETDSTIRRTIDFANKLDPDMVMFTIATPYPKTDLYRLARVAGIVSEDYWKDFTLGKTNQRLPYLVKDAERWTNTAYKEFYFRPSFIWKKIKKIRSWESINKNVRGAFAILSMSSE